MKIIDNENKLHHKITVESDDGGHVMIVVRGRNPYLWIGRHDGPVALFEGNEALRAVAKAILDSLPREKQP